jgi:uncharacterized membrane protein
LFLSKLRKERALKNSRQDEICQELFASAGKILKEAETERRERRRIFISMLLTLSAGILSVPFYLFMNGLFASLLWKWYIVPVFNLAPISWLQGMGVLLLVYVIASLLRQISSSPSKKEADSERSPLERFKAARERILLSVVNYFLGPITAFVFGWILHFFI